VRWNWMLNGQSVEVPCSVGGGFEEAYNYNAAGRVIEKKLALTKTSGSLSGTGMLVAGWTYNNEGQVTSVSYPAHFEGTMTSARVVNHGFDALARLTSVDTKLATVADPSPSWQSVISNAQFNAFGALTTLNHLGLTETRQYNTLGQMTRMTKGSLIDVEYRFSATANDGKIVSQKNWLTGEDVVYAYDELERLISATAGASWGLSWSYDGFGNRLSQNVTAGTAPSNVVLVDANTNRISSSGFSYDLNGNMTLMPKGSGSMTMNYDLSNRMTSVSHPDGSEQYAYSPDNRRVWRSSGRGSCRATRGNDQELYWSGYFQGEGVFEQVILYSPGGQKMGVYCMEFSPNMQYYAVSASEENVFYGGRLVAKRALGLNPSVGTVSDFTADRLQSKGDGSRFYPYGESKTSAAGDDREQFATYTRDEKSGFDYADQRWYASGVGRFTTPDPTSQSISLALPSTWNRFGYVDGDPLNYFDPLGLCKVDGKEYPDGGPECPDTTGITISGTGISIPFVNQAFIFGALGRLHDWPELSTAGIQTEQDYYRCVSESNKIVEDHRKLWRDEKNKRIVEALMDSPGETFAVIFLKLMMGAIVDPGIQTRQ